jgi:hypothetical protein
MLLSRKDKIFCDTESWRRSSVVFNLWNDLDDVTSDSSWECTRKSKRFSWKRWFYIVYFFISLHLSRFLGHKHVSDKCFGEDGEVERGLISAFRVFESNFTVLIIRRNALICSIKMAVWVVFHLKGKVELKKVKKGKREMGKEENLPRFENVQEFSFSTFFVYIIRFFILCCHRTARIFNNRKLT